LWIVELIRQTSRGIARTAREGLWLAVGLALAATTAQAQAPDLPLSRSAHFGMEEWILQQLPAGSSRREMKESPALRRVVDTFPLEWRTTCPADRLTGEKTECWLRSPDYLPVGWDASLENPVGWNAGVSVFCDGAVHGPVLVSVIRYMVGNEVVTVDRPRPDDLGTTLLFTSADGSWADHGDFAFEAKHPDHLLPRVWRFRTNREAVRGFLDGPLCDSDPAIRRQARQRHPISN